ncbi:MAG: hypothetical protein HYT81_01195 [Gemmatimonadetes bacterium]|nr:hypothetical protein [Gemmatimonadota bacterium]
MIRRVRLGHSVALLLAASLLAACAGRRPREVSPAEIPDLEARLEREPENIALRARYAAALFAANRCDDATAAAQRVRQPRPADAVAVLVVGQCAEKAERHAEALGVYRAFLAEYPKARGVAAIRARAQLALRAYAIQQARLALQNEAQLSTQPADPNTVAVLPLTVASADTSYQALSRGLAQMMTSDLSLIQRFRLVERLQLGALLDELRLGQTGRVDPGTAARVGRLVQASRMVQGLANLPPEGEIRLEAAVVQATGEVTAPEAVTGRFRDLLRLEKDLVVLLSARLGYQLSEAERRMILENGTQNLAAFLAYSSGLLAEDAGDFQRAAAYFSDAVRADPGFQAAQEQYQSASVMEEVQQAAPDQAAETAPPAPPQTGPEPGTGGQLDAGTKELAANTSEKAAAPSSQPVQQAINTPAATPPATTTGLGTTQTATGTIRIAFRLP